MLIRFRRSKKGVSEYVAVLLLILITVSGAIILYVYSSGLLGSLQGAALQKPYANQISLEYFDWSGTSTCSTDLHHLCLTLRNVGSGVATLSDFFVSGVKITAPITGTCSGYTGSKNTVTITGTATGTYTVSGLIPQGATSCQAVLTIPSTGPTTTILSGVAYSVRVVTSDGSVFAYSCIAGQSTGSLS